jgi:hypothetical protein
VGIDEEAAAPKAIVLDEDDQDGDFDPIGDSMTEKEEIQGKRECCKAHEKQGEGSGGDFAQGPSGGGHDGDKGQRESQGTCERTKESRKMPPPQTKRFSRAASLSRIRTMRSSWLVLLLLQTTISPSSLDRQ